MSSELFYAAWHVHVEYRCKSSASFSVWRVGELPEAILGGTLSSPEYRLFNTIMYSGAQLPCIYMTGSPTLGAEADLDIQPQRQHVESIFQGLLADHLNG